MHISNARDERRPTPASTPTGKSVGWVPDCFLQVIVFVLKTCFPLMPRPCFTSVENNTVISGNIWIRLLNFSEILI
jgi:hypothetical protein